MWVKALRFNHTACSPDVLQINADLFKNEVKRLCHINKQEDNVKRKTSLKQIVEHGCWELCPHMAPYASLNDGRWAWALPPPAVLKQRRLSDCIHRTPGPSRGIPWQGGASPKISRVACSFQSGRRQSIAFKRHQSELANCRANGESNITINSIQLDRHLGL